MSQAQDAMPRRRPKRVLSALEKHQMYLQLLTGELSQRQAAERWAVDATTVMRIRRVGREGALSALAQSRPGRRDGDQRDVELGAARAEIRAHAAEVPTAELILMGDLLDNPPSTITSLADRTGYAQSRVSTAISSLVKRGWAQTRSDPADGRRTLVFVPDDIRRDAHEFRANSEAHTFDHLLAGRSPARRRAVIAALEELLEGLREQATEERPGTSETLQRGLNSASEPTGGRAARTPGRARR
jgi:MarR family 2-MHQ and catechol resistance regulon transcriptional repressor